MKRFEDSGTDLVILALYCYAPSGQVVPGLLECDIPILLWPTQTFSRLEPAKYSDDLVLCNHGVHGVQDIANLLRRRERPFGLLHGHLNQKGVREEYIQWIQAARVLQSFRKAKPLVLGGSFPDMLDLQLQDEPFLARLAETRRTISFDEFVKIAEGVSQGEITQAVEDYRATFEIGDDVDSSLLEKTARHEVVLRQLLDSHDSRAVGVNFLSLCNDSRILDPLHIAGSRLMAEGTGYGAEGDWATASFLCGLLAASLQVSFTEIFSVGYEDNRLVLKHWGEGNYKLAREKPILAKSSMTDKTDAVFCIVDFEYIPGDATLINFNTTPEGRGQVISITGQVDDEHLAATRGPRGIFSLKGRDVRDVLDGYARNGGSHHLVVAMTNEQNLVCKLADLSGWLHLSL